MRFPRHKRTLQRRELILINKASRKSANLFAMTYPVQDQQFPEVAPASRRACLDFRRVAAFIRVGLLALATSLAGLSSLHAGAQANAAPAEATVWMPALAPRGPLVIVVSLPAQRAYVYRNGVRIGASPVSTGKPGHDTPSGIYTILQKHREHYSNLYDNAPMPFMQRLTWDGVALHAGRVPGYPASHGCVRLPRAFAEQLFAVTTPGTVVVIAAEKTFPPTVTSPGLFAPVDARTGLPTPAPASPDAPLEWFPERAPDGPLTVLLSTRDRRLVVLRNAVEIGRANIEVHDESIHGTRAYVLLEGSLPEPSLAVPDRPALRWMALPLPGPEAATADLRDAMVSGRVSLPADFARALYDTLKPGDTVIVTDEPLQPAGADVTVLSTDADADQ